MHVQLGLELPALAYRQKKADLRRLLTHSRREQIKTQSYDAIRLFERDQGLLK